VIDLGKTDALLPRRHIIPGENFRPGDRVQAYLMDVVLSNRGPQIYMSRTVPEYLMKLFEVEVPEMREGIVEIKLAAREPGARSKIAVISKDSDVDPVGACVGMKGVRVQAVIQELKGEKIDIIPWSDNPIVFVRSALAPADISSIQVNERARAMEIMVEDDQLSLAIGRKGQNVRLAAQLTGWKLDIVSKTKLAKRTEEAVFNLQHIEGVSDTLAQAIYQAGYMNLRQVSDAEIEALAKIPGYDAPGAAEQLKKRAQEVVEKVGDALAGPAPAPGDEKGAFTAQPAMKDAKALAEERLKEMFREAAKKSDSGDGSAGGSSAE
jgi:N utilization substance protein A